MSYRNPQQVVDTQSSQHIQKMQESVSRSFGKFADDATKEYERRAALNREIIKESQQKVNAISGKINQVASENESINFDQMRDNLNTYHEYMQIRPADRSADMNLFISGMNTSGETVKTRLANTMANGQTYIEARKKGLAKMGGMYSGGLFKENEKGELKSEIQKFDIFYGVNKAKGRKTLSFDPVTGKTKIEVFNSKGESVGSSLNSNMDDLDEVQYIPDETKDMTAMADEVAEAMDLKNINSPAYEGQSHQEIKNVKGKRVYSYLPSRDHFLKLAIPRAKAELANMPAGEQIALYNDITRGDNPVIKWQKVWEDEDLDAPNKQKIIESYAAYSADKFAQKYLKVALQAETIRPQKTNTSTDAKTKAAAAKRSKFKADLHAISKDNMTLFQDKVDAMKKMGIEPFIDPEEQNSKRIGVKSDKKAFMDTTGDSRNTMVAMAQTKGFGLAEAEAMVDEVIEEDRIEAEETMKAGFNSVYTVPSNLKNASIAEKLKHKAEAFGKYEKEENARKSKEKEAYEKEHIEKYYKAWLERRAKENFKEEE
jgi:hypothetical protein